MRISNLIFDFTASRLLFSSLFVNRLRTDLQTDKLPDVPGIGVQKRSSHVVRDSVSVGKELLVLKSPWGISPTSPFPSQVSGPFPAGDTRLWGTEGSVHPSLGRAGLAGFGCLGAAYGGWLQPECFQLLGKRL